MQSVSSRIWTRVAVSISYDDNHYTTDTSIKTIVIKLNVIVVTNLYLLSVGIQLFFTFLIVRSHPFLHQLATPIKNRSIFWIENTAWTDRQIDCAIWWHNQSSRTVSGLKAESPASVRGNRVYSHKFISSKANLITRVEFELAYFKVAVTHCNQYAIDTSKPA